MVDAVDDQWDKFESVQAYDEFTRQWLTACKRVLKPTGTIRVTGSYHNIFRVGAIMQDLGFWIFNDVIWVKTNPMPDFRGVRFTNAHETLIRAGTEKGAKYTFNYCSMKGLNDEKQMRSDWWLLSLATGAERVKDDNGDKAHSTQKPESLLYRVILSSSKPGDVVLDPFFGSGTTGAVAKKLHRNWIGLEREKKYIETAQKRIDAVQPEAFDSATFDTKHKTKSFITINFSTLVENGCLRPGQKLFFGKDERKFAVIKPDSRLLTADGFEGSIHAAGSHYMNNVPCNGWECWFLYENGQAIRLDDVRKKFMMENGVFVE